jgi:hypothetical protein
LACCDLFLKQPWFGSRFLRYRWPSLCLRGRVRGWGSELRSAPPIALAAQGLDVSNRART